MKNRASKLDARVDKVAAGFTIIETILFIAIAGLVFTGVIVGTNGAIRRQRYKDSVQSFTDDIRDLYSVVENTEVLDYGKSNVLCGVTGGASSSTKTGRGRSACSVYGLIAKIQLSSLNSSSVSGENIESYWLIGIDEKEVSENRPIKSTDSRFLKDAEVSPFISYKDSVSGHITEANAKIEAKKSSLYWGAELNFACSAADGSFTSSAPCQSGKTRVTPEENKYLYLIIYRSPVSRNVRTLAMYSDNSDLTNVAGSHVIDSLDAGNDPDGNGDEANINIAGKHYAGTSGKFGREEVRICVTAGKGMSYGGGLRMISIKKDASIQDDVRLVEADDEENICN